MPALEHAVALALRVAAARCSSVCVVMPLQLLQENSTLARLQIEREVLQGT